MPRNILRLRAFSQKIGLARSTIYDKLDPQSPRHDPEFPKPIKLSERAIGFIESEAEDYLSRLIQKSRKAASK